VLSGAHLTDTECRESRSEAVISYKFLSMPSNVSMRPPNLREYAATGKELLRGDAIYSEQKEHLRETRSRSKHAAMRSTKEEGSAIL
jgi:hypothetical protein